MSFTNLDLNLLRIFDEVMAQRNLSRAAQALALTQPAISQGIKRLRDILKDELFTRVARGVEPTPYAEALWPDIRQAMDTLRLAIEPRHFDPALCHSTLRLAMADSTAALFMPDLFKRVQAQAPQASFRVLPLNTRDPSVLLEKDEIDLAIGYFPKAVSALSAPGARSAVLHERLYDGEYVVVMREGHPLSGKKLTLDLYCAAAHLLVSFSGRAFGFVDEALAAIGRKRRVQMTVNQFFTAGQVVMNSDLLTVLPKHFLRSTGLDHELVSQAMPFQVSAVHVEMLWARHPHRPEEQAWLRDHVRAIALEKFPKR